MKTKKLLALFFFVSIAFLTNAQDYSSYQTGFTTGTDANLYKLKDGTPFDMSSSTERIAASQDNVQTGNINFGFGFYHYSNSRQTIFRVNSNGVIRLGGAPGGTRTGILRNNWRLLSPLAGDLATSATGKVHTKTIGSAPNRVMVVEFLNMEIDKTSADGIGTFQVRFYETIGMIEFVYGDFTGTEAGTFEAGISWDDNNGRYVSIAADHSTSMNPLNTFTTVSQLDPGSGTGDDRRYYRFISVAETKPAAPIAPTGAMFTAPSCGNLTFNWKDNSTTETWFDVYSSTDGLVYTFQGREASTTWATTGTDYSYVAQNLTPNTNYYYKIIARNDSYTPEAISEFESSPTFETTNASASVVTAIVSGSWDNGAIWDSGVEPTSCDDVVIPAGFTVDVNDNGQTDYQYCKNLTVEGTLQFKTSNSDGRLYVGGNTVVNATGNFITENSSRDHRLRLYLSNNLTVNSGNFDMDAATRGTSVYFYNPQDAVIDGAGGTCNFHYLYIDKGNTPTGFSVDATRPITIEDPVAELSSRLVINNGTFKISSNCGTLKPYRGNVTVCAATGKFFLSNAGTTIEWTAAGLGSATASGDFEVTAGIYNTTGLTARKIFKLNSGTLNCTTGDLNLALGSTSTISNGTTITLFDDLLVYDDLTVSDATTSITCDDAVLYNNSTTQLGILTWTDADLTVTDDFIMNGATTISGASAVFTIGDDVIVNNNQSTGVSNGTLNVTNSTFTCDDFILYGATTLTNVNIAVVDDVAITRHTNTSTNGSLTYVNSVVTCDDFVLNGTMTVTGATSSITLVDDFSITTNSNGSTNGNLTFADGAITCDAFNIYGSTTINSGTITAANSCNFYDNTTTNNGSLTMNGGSFSSTITINNRCVTILNNSSALSAGTDLVIYGYGGYTGSFTMNNTSTASVSRNCNVTGNLTMTDNSILTAGDGNDVFAVSRAKTVNLSGNAIINQFGNMDFLNSNGASNLIMAGNSKINLDPQHTQSDAADDVLLFESNTTATCTGGTITFIDPNSSNNSRDNNTFDIKGTAANMDFSGATIQFGDGTSVSNGASGADGGFKIRTYTEDIILGNIIVNNIGGSDREVHINREGGQADNFDFTCNNLTITAGTFDVEFHTLTVKENITNAGSLLSTNLTTGEINFNGTVAQSYSGAGSYDLDNLAFDNSSTGVTLNAHFGAKTITLTNGLVHTTTANYLIVEGTATTNLVGGTPTVFVNGPMIRNIGDSETGDYYFPIGKSSNYHATWLNSVVSTAGTGNYLAEFFEIPPSGSPVTGFKMDAPNAQTYWKYTQSGTNVLTSANVKLYQTNPALIADHAVGQSNTDALLSYQPRGANTSIPTIESTLPLDLTFPSNETYFVIGIVDVICGSGVITVGTGGDYTTLTEVFTALTMYSIPCDCDIKIRADYLSAAETETLPIVVPVITYAGGPWITTLLPEVANRVVEGTPPTTGDPLLIINGTDNFVVEGRIDKTGAPNNLTFRNTEVAADAGSTIKMNADIGNVTVQYTNFEGRTTQTDKALIEISEPTSAGNDAVTIIQNDFSDYAGENPNNMIYAVGAAGMVNDNNTISQNNFHDFTTNAILIASNNTDWDIVDNKIYNTASQSITGDMTGIRINASSGNDFNINGNTIGYANSSGTGDMTLTGSGTFTGIRTNTSNGGTISKIDNNTVINIDFTTSNISSSNQGIFCGIYAEGGKINIGNTTANTIGSTTTNNVIDITLNGSGGYIQGIYAPGNNLERIENNLIGGITANGATENGAVFRGIITDGSANPIISNNTIGSTTQANSIAIGANGITTAVTRVVGIYNSASGTSFDISNNTIANLTAFGFGTEQAESRGIRNLDGIGTINNNIIQNITTYAQHAGTNDRAVLIGISQRSADDGIVVSRNTISGLEAHFTSETPDQRIYGIYATPLNDELLEVTEDKITGNFIHSFSSPCTDAEQRGIYVVQGQMNVYNNMIRLGIDKTGADNANQVRIYGIYDNTDYDNNFFYNSVYIGGTVTTPEANRNTYCFFKDQSSITNIQNNIFINDRSNNATVGSDNHFAYYVLFASLTTSDYNIYGAAGTDGVAAELNGMQYSTLREMQFFTDYQEMHSAFGTVATVNFVNPTGNSSNVNLHLQSNSAAESTGLVIKNISSDIDAGGTRTGTNGDITDIGADAGNYTITNVEDIFAPTFEYTYTKKYSDISVVPDPIVYNVIIRDQGSPTIGGIDETNKPRIYFRRAGSNTGSEIDAWGVNAGAFAYVEGTKTTGGGLYSEWDFDLSYITNFDGDLANLDLVEFFFVAQDIAGNVAYSNFDDVTPVFTDVATVTSWPDAAAVEYFAIGVSLEGDYYITDNATSLADQTFLGTIDDDREFPTITGMGGMFQAINSAFLSDNINVYVMRTHNETGTYPLEPVGYQPANGDFMVNIIPYDATDKTMTCDASFDLLSFEGSANVLIDGRFASAGTDRFLTFQQNTNTQTVATFYANAQDITIRNCVLKGSADVIPKGVIKFADGFDFNANSTEEVEECNKNITILNNSLSNNTNMPINMIFSESAWGLNNNITIQGNEISNFEENGIWITETGNGDSWTISDNIIFNDQTGLEYDNSQYCIHIDAGESHTISGNIIGNSNATQTGADWDYNGSSDRFYGIAFTQAIGAATSTVDNNTIKDITTDDVGFYGIYNDGTDNASVNITNNTIQDITIKADVWAASYGIYHEGIGGDNIANNTIQDIDNQNRSGFTALYMESSDEAATTIDGNIIQGINNSHTGNRNHLRAIFIDQGWVEIGSLAGNTIGGTAPSDYLQCAGTDSEGVIGICFADDRGNCKVENNIIAGLRSNSATLPVKAIEIIQTGSNILINNNTISDLQATVENMSVTGIDLINANTATVSNNTIGANTFPLQAIGTGEVTAIKTVTTSGTISNNNILYLQNDGLINGILSTGATNIISTNTFGNINSTNNNDVYLVNSSGATATITANTATNLTATGNSKFYFINSSGATADINTNNITTISLTGASAEFYGIYSDEDDVEIQGNTISAVTMAGASSKCIGINLESGSGNVGTTTPNVVGHATNADAILSPCNSLVGILATGNSSHNISNNIIANITGTNTTNTASVTAIELSGSGAMTIANNDIHDVKSASTKTVGTDGRYAAQALFLDGNAAMTIANNNFTGIIGTGNGSDVTAIAENGENFIIEKNKIYGITNTGTGGTVTGIGLNKLNAGYVSNNMISLGAADASEYHGVWIPNNNTNTKKIYFNSIYIGAVATGGNSYAFARENNSTPLDVKNNIFSNFRTGGTANYAITNKNSGDWTTGSYTEANNYYSADGTVANWGGANKTFAEWIALTGEDDYYFSTDAIPNFNDAPNCDLSINPTNACNLNNSAVPLPIITDDFQGDVRTHDYSDIGADEYTPTGRTGVYIWRGGKGTNWDTDKNWRCDLTPGDNQGDLIIVPNVLDNIATIQRTSPASTVITDAIEITNTGYLIIAPNNSLTTDGAINGSGKLRAKRFINAGQWHEVSAPINTGAGGNANSAIFTETNPSGNYNVNFYYYDETVDLDNWSGASSNTTNPTGTDAFEPDSLVPGWTYAHGESAGTGIPLNENQGYMFYTDMNQTIQFVGDPTTGNYNVSGLTYTDNDPRTGTLPDLYDGWHLLGNPYPSSLDWDAMKTTRTNLDDGIYVWNNNQYSGYVAGSSVMGGSLTNKIAPMQGFFVHATAGGAGVNIANTYRTHGETEFLKKKDNKQVHNNLLKLKTSANGYDDYIIVYFKPEAIEEYDSDFDMVRIFTYYTEAPQLFAICGEANDMYAATCLPQETMQNKIIPLGLQVQAGTGYTISVEEFNDFENVQVYLIDSLENNKINLRNINSYTFDFAGGKIKDRFYLQFEGNHAPILENQISDKETLEDQEFNFTFPENTFIDEDFDDILRYEVQNLPSWLNFDSDTRTFTGLPLNENVGETELELIAFDTFNESDTAYFTLTVINTNDAPTVESQIPDMETNVKVLYTYQIPENIFNDVDLNDYLTYTAQLEGEFLLPEWLNFNNETRTLSGTPNSAEVINIEITATDLAGENISDIFELTILDLVNISETNNIEVEIYPNPATNFIYINLTDFQNPTGLNMQITNIAGELILEKNIVSSQTTIDIKEFAIGTYLIEISNGTDVFIEKIIKK